jgi:adenylate cyclase class 2
MMREIELKLRFNTAEREKLIAWCERSGYAAGEPTEQIDHYLMPGSINLFANDEAFRVRRSSCAGKTVWSLIFKGKNTGTTMQERQELETAVEDGEVLIVMLERLGIREILTVKKTRISFRKGAVTICLDRVESLGEFLEIEIMTEGGNIVSARRKINELVKSMALETAMPEPKNYLQLLWENR